MATTSYDASSGLHTGPGVADRALTLRVVIVGVLVSALAGGCSLSPDRHQESPRAAATTAPPTSPSAGTASPAPSSRTAVPLRNTVTRAASGQLTGLVRIVASIGNDGRGETSTGMVLRDDGEVVTNNHAVAGATAIEATVMSTGRTYRARVTAADPRRDIALLRLDGAEGLTAVTFAQREASVGQRVTVVGDARGRRSQFAAATGTVVDRDQTLLTPATETSPGERLTGVVLSTCDVVSGESGGPTYDARRQVVGMTTASVRTSSGLGGVAIPLSTLRSVVRALEGRS